ncbi:hypothetical protein B4099_3837 [Heyndrickxia coagulans]|uniref:Uncharacterized protein n=1 Tax=Heyndrickxia coagulans TaxID=1398 RepID=A0A150JQ12_HEYCO|nr:hypothetical protein B4099_3837 [Heyndrickxia coagulans]
MYISIFFQDSRKYVPVTRQYPRPPDRKPVAPEPGWHKNGG